LQRAELPTVLEADVELLAAALVSEADVVDVGLHLLQKFADVGLGAKGSPGRSGDGVAMVVDLRVPPAYEG
jgi:hypothetical protein